MNREQRRAFARENGVPMPPVPEPQVQELPFSPVPTNFSVLGAQVGGQDQVLLIVTTPLGQQGYFMPAEVAKRVAGFLHQTASAAASGLTVIGNPGGTPEVEAT